MTKKAAEVLLVTVLLLRSTSFVFSRLGLNSLEMYNLLALRYLIAFFLLAVIWPGCRKNITKKTVLKSLLLSTVFFGIMSCEMRSIQSIGASTTCFLENTAIVIVPFLSAFLARKKPSVLSVTGSFIALTGVALISLRNGFSALNTGICWSLGGALLYACFITLNGRICDESDSLQIGFLQNGFLGLFSLTTTILFESPRLPADSTEWICVLGLAILCSALGLTLQPVAQSHMSADRAGILTAISPVSTGIQNYLILGESLGPAGVLGAFLIMFSILMPKILTVRKSGKFRKAIPLLRF